MEKKIRVTIWNEFRHEKEKEWIRAIYPNGIHAVIKEFLDTHEELEVRLAALDDPDQGLPNEVLNNTDVLIWWGHMHHKEVSDELVEKIRIRVMHEGMGFIPLHSAHKSKPFQAILGTTGRLMWGENQREFLWNCMPAHPIAFGIGEHIELESEEMYGEPFLVPQPDELVFLGWFEGGYVFRSGCCYYRGRGKVFYFQPGHEECRSYMNPEIQKIIYNAVKWAAPSEFGSPLCDCERRDRLV